MPSLITVADDFGLSPAVNEAVEIAARDGILTTASLMVAAPHAADAVRRAKALGDRLAVGLHLVVIEGPAILPPSAIPHLVDSSGQFPSDQLCLGLAYAFNPASRRQLEAEIRAQFEAFAATGLPLDHANAHKHMHLHPVVGAMMIRIGRAFGLRAIRVPAEPRPQAGPWPLADRALHAWTRLLRHQARRAGLITNDAIFGLAATGHMTPARVQAMVQSLPPGLSELYFHPATSQDETLRRLMPGYQHEAEFDALLRTIVPANVTRTRYSDLPSAAPPGRPGRPAAQPDNRGL
jgi:hopanoid biosynthesis associated protein HpnK